MKILDTAQILIDIRLGKFTWGKVTLKINDEFEIRFCRITIKNDGSLWFQPPKLKEFNWACCFGVLDKDDFHRLSQRVEKLFVNLLKEKVDAGELPPSLIEKIESAHKEELTEEDYKRIEEMLGTNNTDLNDTNSH